MQQREKCDEMQVFDSKPREEIEGLGNISEVS